MAKFKVTVVEKTITHYIVDDPDIDTEDEAKELVESLDSDGAKELPHSLNDAEWYVDGVLKLND